jgi:hypothetical protein
MAMMGCNPRVNAAMLAQFVGQNVTLVGKVVSIDGMNSTISAACGGTVNVVGSEGANLEYPR